MSWVKRLWEEHSKYTNTDFNNFETGIREAKERGLQDPRESPYNAKCDGVTDDSQAFHDLVEAWNAGTIKGFFVPGPVKFTSKLHPPIKGSGEILFFPGAYFDLSTWDELKETGSGLVIEGVTGATAALTADATVGQSVLKCGTAYADGTILKISQSEEEWAPSLGKMGELVEVGTPSGGLSGRKVEAGGFEYKEIKSGQKLTQIGMLNLNPSELIAETPTSVIPNSGEIKIGSQTAKYSSKSVKENSTVFELEAELTATATYPQGTNISLVAEAGTVYLRTPISSELGYKSAKGGKVRPLTMAGPIRIVSPKIKGPAAQAYVGGIFIKAAKEVKIYDPVVEDCNPFLITFNDSWHCKAYNPDLQNARYQSYEGVGAEGYGISFTYATQDCEVYGGKSVRTRHAITTGGTGGEGLPRRNIVYDHIAYQTNADAFDTHGGTYDMTYIRCVTVMAKGQGFTCRGPKVKMVACKAIRPVEGCGVFCQSQSTIGKTEYDVECEVIEPHQQGFRVVGTSATEGKVSGFVKIRGSVQNGREGGVLVEGKETAGSVDWRQRNVDIDVQIIGTPTQTTTNRAVHIFLCEGARVRVQALDVLAKATAVLVNDCVGFTVELGPLSWASADAANRGVLIKSSVAKRCVQGVVNEGPMINLSTGKSTEVEANAEKVFVIGGPEENIAFNAAPGCKKATFA